MQEKLSEVIMDVDTRHLEENKKWFASVERLRQIWNGKGSARGVKLFYSGRSFSKNAWETAKEYFDNVTSNPEVKAFGNMQTDKHSTFLNKFNALNTLVKFYVIITYNELDGKHTNFNPETCKPELDKAFKNANENNILSRIERSIKNQSVTDYQRAVQSAFLQSIITLANNISQYLDDVYDEGAKSIFDEYSDVFKRLRNTKELKNGLDSSISATVGLGKTDHDEDQSKIDYEVGRSQKAFTVLTGLAFIAAEAKKDDMVDLCNRLLDRIPN